MPVGGSLLTGLIAELVVTVIVLSVGYLYRAKIWRRFKKLSAWLVNSEVQVQITRVDKFTKSPQNDIDLEVFNQIKNQYPGVENAGLSENTLRIRANDIPTVLEIRIDQEYDFNEMQPDVVGHKLVIETYSDLRFGYRTYGSLDRFENMSEDIANIVQTHCFTGTHSTQSFILTRLKKGIPADIESIEDEELGITGEVKDSTMQLTFQSPQHLSAGIRRYYRPISIR